MPGIQEQKTASTGLLQLVSFVLGNEEYGLDILCVQEINRMLQLTKLPNAPEYVDGVINLRGRVIPVINLRHKLGLSRKEYDNSTRIIVVEVNNKTIGFVVDGVREVLRIPVSVTEAPPEIASGINSEFIKSVGKLEDRLLIHIDPEKILSNSDEIDLHHIN